jgi:hypothetical protein
MKADGGELDGESARKMDPSLYGFHELWDVSVTRIESGMRVDHANKRAGKCILAVTSGFDEYFSQE